jgi:hypothetical protein
VATTESPRDAPHLGLDDCPVVDDDSDPTVVVVVEVSPCM